MLESQGSFYFVNRQFSCSLLSSIRPRGRNQCALWGPGQETEGLRKQGQLSWPFRCFGLCVLRTRNLTVACGRGQPRCGAPGWAEGPPPPPRDSSDGWLFTHQVTGVQGAFCCTRWWIFTKLPGRFFFLLFLDLDVTVWWVRQQALLLEL